MNIGTRIREYWGTYWLTEKKLAELLGVDKTTLAGLERGEHQPSKGLLEMLTALIISSTMSL
jgi:transcriptional regulator with XRE-family HTH domain